MSRGLYDQDRQASFHNASSGRHCNGHACGSFMKITIIYYIQDVAAMLAIFVIGAMLIVAGTAYGLNHCQRNNCSGYEILITTQGESNE